jgi:hypothetical protein
VQLIRRLCAQRILRGMDRADIGTPRAHSGIEPSDANPTPATPLLHFWLTGSSRAHHPPNLPAPPKGAGGPLNARRCSTYARPEGPARPATLSCAPGRRPARPPRRLPGAPRRPPPLTPTSGRGAAPPSSSCFSPTRSSPATSTFPMTGERREILSGRHPQLCAAAQPRTACRQ